MKISEVLFAAKNLIASPSAWTKGNYALNNTYSSVLPTDPTACKFCMHGALARAQNCPTIQITKGIIGEEELAQAITYLQPENRFTAPQPNQTIYGFNDHRNTTHANVLEVFDLAIRLALNKESAS